MKIYKVYGKNNSKIFNEKFNNLSDAIRFAREDIMQEYNQFITLKDQHFVIGDNYEPSYYGFGDILEGKNFAQINIYYAS